MSRKITVSQHDLAAAFAAWEAYVREHGTVRTPAEVAALPVQQVADERAEYLWQILARGHDRRDA